MTHDADGTLDVVCTRDDLPPPTIDVIDIGLSDHRLLRWQSCLLRLPPVYVKTTRRSWRRRPAGRGDRLMTIRSRQTCGCLHCATISSGLGSTVTVSWSCMTTSSPHCSIDRLHCGPRPAAVDRPIRGSTMNVGQRNVHCGHLSALHVVLGHCLTPRRRPYRCGALNAGVTLVLFNRSV